MRSENLFVLGSLLGSTLLGSTLVACDPPLVPTAEDTAAYLGLVDGKTFTYAGSNVTETHEIKKSSLVAPDTLTFDIIAKQNGFIVDDRTLTLELSVDAVRLARFFDCVTRCGQPSTKIDVFEIPLDGGNQKQTDVEVALTENGADAGTAQERHTFLVNNAAPVTVAGEELEGFLVSWTRVRDDDTETSLFTIVEDRGIVKWTGFDGTEIALAE